MRSAMWMLGFVTLFCMAEAKLADIRNDNTNVLDEENKNDRDWTETKEYEEASKIVDEKIEQMDIDDITEFREDISYCMERLDIHEMFSGGLKKMKHACLNLRDLENCMNAVGKDFFGYDIQTLAKIYWDDPIFGKGAKSFMRYYKVFQHACTEDKAVFKDDIHKIKEKYYNCMKVVDFKNLFPGGSKKIKDVCLNLLDYFDCKDKFLMDFLGHDAAYFESLFSGTTLGNNIRLYMNSKTTIQDMCSKDSMLSTDDDTTENEGIAECMKIMDIESLLAGKFKTTNDVCPKAFKYLKCLEEVVKDTLGLDIAIFAKVSPDTSDLGKYSRIYMKLKSTLKGLCPKESALFKDDIVLNGDIVQCLKMMDIENLYHGSSEKLEDICPNILNFTNCMEEYIKEDVGHDVVFLETLLSGSNLGNGIKLFTNLKTMAQEFCSKDSDLYRDYKMDEECFENIYYEEMDVCKKDSKVVYETFSKMNNYEDTKNKGCLQNGYLVACLGAEVHEKCGKRAFNTYSEAINKSDVFRLKFCSEAALDVFKTSFLESLNMNADRQDLFRQVLA